jgi:hypothetical protein
MPRKVSPLPDWIPQACELMVRYDLTLRQAAVELGTDLTVEEAEALHGPQALQAMSGRRAPRPLHGNRQQSQSHQGSRGGDGFQNGRAAQTGSRGLQKCRFTAHARKNARLGGTCGRQCWKTLPSLNHDELTELKNRLREPQQAQAAEQMLGGVLSG